MCPPVVGKKLAQYYLYFLLASGLGEEMLVDTAGIVDVLLVLVCVAASHVLAVPPLLPATGLVRAALTTFGIVIFQWKHAIEFYQMLLKVQGCRVVW